MSIFEDSLPNIASEDWLSIDTTTLHDAVVACVERGWLLSFGCSRDGGASSITVLSDEGKHRKWASGTEELQRALEAVLTAARGPQVTSPRTAPQRASESPTGASDGKPRGSRNASKAGG